MQNCKLNIGCGNTLPSGWINLDSSWHARIAKVPGLKKTLLTLKLLPAPYGKIEWHGEVQYQDLNRPLKFADQSVEVIYASHLLEHLFLSNARKLLAECFRVCKPQGVIRIVVPDLDGIVQGYQEKLAAGKPEEANRFFMESLCMIPDEIAPPLWIRLFRGYHDKNLHRFMYNQKHLSALLKEAGFTAIESRQLYESRIADIRSVEKAERLQSAICLEAIKT